MPWIYDRTSGSLSSRYTTSINGYLDNLALTDRTLGDLLRDLKASGMRDRTTIILSSDHWWRGSPLVDGVRDNRIPLMIQLAGDRQAFVYDGPINTITIANIIRDIINGTITNNKNLLARMQTGANDTPSRYSKAGVLLEPSGSKSE